jgi:TRAP transporter TAXI family solute receptor
MSAINSAGSGENVRLLREDEAQFAILQGLFGFYARSGTGPIDEPQENLRSVTMLWQNVEHFIVANDFVQDGTMSDLADMTGEPMAMGRRNSGTIGSNRTLVAGFGIDMDADFDLLYAGYTPSAEALQNGQVSGMGAPGGPPVGAISQLMAAAGDSFTILEVTDEEMATADGGKNLWTRYVIEAGTYPNQDEDIATIAQPNFLAVRDDVSEEHVYLFTKTVFENLPFLQAIHPATNAMSLEAALAGLPFPLHPGAARYYEEAGLDIPDRLIAD